MKKAPAHGYYLPLWRDGLHYRSTALVYMQREHLSKVQNKDGNEYSLEEVRASIITTSDEQG
jgi:hypothetical protein